MNARSKSIKYIIPALLSPKTQNNAYILLFLTAIYWAKNRSIITVISIIKINSGSVAQKEFLIVDSVGAGP